MIKTLFAVTFTCVLTSTQGYWLAIFDIFSRLSKQSFYSSYKVLQAILVSEMTKLCYCSKCCSDCLWIFSQLLLYTLITVFVYNYSNNKALWNIFIGYIHIVLLLLISSTRYYKKIEDIVLQKGNVNLIFPKFFKILFASLQSILS